MAENAITDIVANVEEAHNQVEDAKTEGRDDGQDDGQSLDDGTSQEGAQAAAQEAKALKKATEQIKKNNKRKYKVKVDQREEELEFDPDNEQEVIKHLQLSRAAQKRMQESSELKRDVTDLFTRLNTDPFSVLADAENGLGMNVEDLVKQYVEKKLADAEKSPEQLEFEKTQNELRKLKAEREQEKIQREKERYDAQLQNEIIRYDQMMTKTLENSEFKKPSPYLVKKMSDYLILGVQNGLDVTPDDILPIVRDEIQSEIRELINSAPENVIEELFGKEIFNKMRKKNLAKAKQAPIHASSIKDAGIKGKTPEKPVEKVSARDFFSFKSNGWNKV
jgi:hypothetical protein